MKDITLPKTGGAAQLSVLDESALPDVLALQEATRAALPEDKKMFILPQGMGYFQNFLTRLNGVMIGIRSEGLLVAQMAVMGPMPLREAIALHAITGNDISFHHAALTDSVIIFKSMASHPDWRGNELSSHLVSYALDLPLTKVVNHVFAQTSVGNKRSWGVFMRHRFGIVGAGYDPRDKQPRFVFQKPIFGFDFANEIIADDVDPANDFSAIVTLTQREALIGLYEEGSTTKLAFFRNREILNLMPVLAKLQSQQ